MYQSQLRLRKSEEKFKSFYNDDPVMHVSVNLETGVIVECNKRFINKMEYSSREDIIGRKMSEFHAYAGTETVQKLSKKLIDNTRLVNEEVQYKSRTGKLIDAIINSTITEDENSNLLVSRSTMLDVTELKAVQKQLDKEKENLIAANRELEQFVSICSHDLQEPLGTIRFGSEIVIKKFSDNLEPKGKEYLNYIFDAAGRLSKQIRALLDYSRLGDSKERELVDIKELTNVVLYDLTKRIKENNAKIHVGALPKIEVYKTEFRLLLQNLIGNALKYRKKDVAPVIKISSYEDGDYEVFSIADNGIGIPEENIDSIFTIFSRVPTEDPYEGTGVGLAHCEKIIKLHEGRIWVDSQLGIGSTFYFKIKK